MREENIEKMNFKELRNEVQYLRDELAMFKRKFNDIIYNLDSDNFGKSFVVAQNNMKAQIKINAEEIATKVSTEDFNSEITQTADKIRSVVASNAFNNAEEVSVWLPTGKDEGKIYVVRGTPADTYYYYNDYDNEWKTSSGHDLYTVFEQNASGFKLKGDVSIYGRVVANSLQGETITGTTISGSTINSGSIYSGFFSDSSSENNKFVLDSNAVHFMRHGLSSSLIDYFGITFSDNDKNIVFAASPPSASSETTQEFLEIYRLQSNTIYAKPLGNWDFSGCDDIYWGSNAPSVAVFG